MTDTRLPALPTRVAVCDKHTGRGLSRLSDRMRKGSTFKFFSVTGVEGYFCICGKPADWHIMEVFVNEAVVQRVDTQTMIDVLHQHHVRVGVMASPGHWAYGDPADKERPRWFAHCGSQWEDEQGCGWDSEPDVYHTKTAALLRGEAHIADMMRRAFDDHACESDGHGRCKHCGAEEPPPWPKTDAEARTDD